MNNKTYKANKNHPFLKDVSEVYFSEFSHVWRVEYGNGMPACELPQFTSPDNHPEWYDEVVECKDCGKEHPNEMQAKVILNDILAVNDSGDVVVCPVKLATYLAKLEKRVCTKRP